MVIQRKVGRGRQQAGLAHAATGHLANAQGARAIKALLPHSMEPTGAPSPLLKQTDTLSKWLRNGAGLGQVRVSRRRSAA